MYYFLYFLFALDSRIQTIAFLTRAQVIQNKQQYKRSANCYLEGASDVPAAGKYPGQPKEQQDPARATANEAALKRGNRPEEPADGAVDITTALNRLGRPVTSAGQRNATPMRVAFRVSGAF
ncbi:MAG: hypothetical protein ACLPY1_07665 [Terracidiphilus sp.]